MFAKPLEVQCLPPPRWCRNQKNIPEIREETKSISTMMPSLSVLGDPTAKESLQMGSSAPLSTGIVPSASHAPIHHEVHSISTFGLMDSSDVAKGTACKSHNHLLSLKPLHHPWLPVVHVSSCTELVCPSSPCTESSQCLHVAARVHGAE